MDERWSEQNKKIQKLLRNNDTFAEGIETLIAFRLELFQQITEVVENYPKEAFFQRPFPDADGYHSKTLAYSVWHIFRIEDIVAHELIAGDEQVFFREGFETAIQSSIITTGNELRGEELEAFSKQLDIPLLYSYAKAVMESTDIILRSLKAKDRKRSIDPSKKERLEKSGCVSKDKDAVWLIDYWCTKNIEGLIKMPLSRHWIMHIEAMQRIKRKLCKLAKKNVDPVAYCGFSCKHCFLTDWCGFCRTDYNTCSFAAIYPDRKCPNMTCCMEKGFDGCYECEDILDCQKGFYVPDNDGAAAAKAQALYIKTHGKKEFLNLQDRLHNKFDFSKTQEILGQDLKEAIRILEEH